MSIISLESTITCPQCGFVKQELMPTDACQFYYECGECKSLLRPRPGDCCVFCSYGSVPCPPVQATGGCCEASRTRTNDSRGLLTLGVGSLMVVAMEIRNAGIDRPGRGKRALDHVISASVGTFLNEDSRGAPSRDVAT